MTIEILNFTEALRLTETGKRIIKEKVQEKVITQVRQNTMEAIKEWYHKKKKNNGI